MDGSTQQQTQEAPAQLPAVAAGEQWAMPKDGPWGGHYPPVTIIDVLGGWVRYGMGELFPDCRMEEAAFVRLYKSLATFDRGALQ